MQNPVNKEKQRFADYCEEELHYYEKELPSQTLEFEYLDDAWDYLKFLWLHSKHKGLILSTSFKAILTGDENQLVRVTISGVKHYTYEYTYL